MLSLPTPWSDRPGPETKFKVTGMQNVPGRGCGGANTSLFSVAAQSKHSGGQKSLAPAPGQHSGDPSPRPLPRPLRPAPPFLVPDPPGPSRSRTESSQWGTNVAVNKTLFTESGRGRGCPVCGPRREAWALPRLETREQPWLGGCRGGGVTPRYPAPFSAFWPHACMTCVSYCDEMHVAAAIPATLM